MDNVSIRVNGFLLQNSPKIYVAMIPGAWLLKRTTPSWRIDDPDQGFQRMVREDRAREIAITVLDQSRTFPNAIVLATDKSDLLIAESMVLLPDQIKFLVVDGQHRLWAQKYSKFEANYACVIHMGLSEVEMARLFLEINDNQKRVPPSLRWDLVRLVRPNDDPYSIVASDMVYLLATEQESPLYQRIDLTGEQSEILLKQASLAPDIKLILSKRSLVHEISFDEQYHLLLVYFIAIKELDPDNWGKKESIFYKARVLRALLRLLPDIIKFAKKPINQLTNTDFINYLKKIDMHTLETKEILAVQGSAGIKDIYERIYAQVFPRSR
jgi:DGQHR domain-containing protein